MKTRYLKECKPRKVETPWMKGFKLPEKLDDLAIAQLHAKKTFSSSSLSKRRFSKVE